MRNTILLGMIAVLALGCAGHRQRVMEHKRLTKLQRSESGPYVSTELFSAAYRERFDREICAGVDKAACQAKFDQTLDAKLAVAYPMADGAEVKQLCVANPFDCKDPIKVERWVIQSHNRRANDALENINNQMSDATTAGLGGVGRAITDARKPAMIIESR